MHRKIILSILTLLLAFGGVNTPSSAEELTFAQVGDVRYSLDNGYLDKYLYFLSSSIRKKFPEFVVFLGDNVNKSREEDVIGFMRAIHSIRTPYYLVLGNEDAHKMSGIDKENFLDIVTTFNRNQDDNKRYYYFKPNSDFVCVVLDVNPDFAPSKHSELPEEQLEWLDKLLTKYANKKFIIFQHSPLVPPRSDYKLSMVNTEKYENLLKKHSNIVAISSGHYSQNAVSQDENGIRHISAPAFKDMPHSYQLIKIIYDEKTYKSPKDVEIVVTRVRV